MNSLVVVFLLCLCFCFGTVHGAAPAVPNATSTCLVSINLEWSTRVGSSVFASPRIVDLGQNGQKDILVPTFSQFLEALRGETGDDVEGFPFFHPKLKSYASPLPVDLNGDGQTEWLLALYSGDLVVVNEEAKPVGVIRIPPLSVKLNWRTLSNHSNDDIAALRASRPRYSAKVLRSILRSRRVENLEMLRTDPSEPPSSGTYGRGGSNRVPNHRGTDRVGGVAESTGTPPDAEETAELPLESDDTLYDIIHEAYGYDDDDDEYDSYDDIADEETRRTLRGEKRIGPFGAFSPEAVDSMSILFNPELYSFHTEATRGEDFDYTLLRGKLETVVREDEIAVPAHILSTPVIADVDGNGDLDVIVHVSYFFDADDVKKARAKPTSSTEPSSDVDYDAYVATAVVCINLVTGEVRWTRILHVTTRSDPFPSFGLSSPLVVNADSDKDLEVYVSTTCGRVHSFTGKGEARPGWPVSLGPMTASPTSEDIVGDGSLAVCVGDVAGNVGCWRSTGAVLWTREIEGGLADRIHYADVNRDGHVDLIFGTTSGYLYALDGRTGVTLDHFPVITKGPIVAPILPVGLLSLGIQDGVHLVFPSHDGLLYIVDGTTGCIQTVDIDEQSSSMVLADDITGNGKTDLLVTTIRGGVYVFETDAPFHPLKTWSSKTKGLNGFSAAEQGTGIFITPKYRTPRDIRGDSFFLEFSIADANKKPKVRSTTFCTVDILIGTRTRILKKSYSSPGVYRVRVRAPLERKQATVTVRMVLPNGQVYTDTISLSFNMHFLETVKFAVLVPLAMTMFALMAVRKRHEVDDADVLANQYY